MSPTILLPIVGGGESLPCNFNRLAYTLFELIRQHPQQERRGIVCHPTLVQVAQAKAADMFERNYYTHVDPDGHGANYLVTQAGYGLPSSYIGDSLNYIESIAKNTPTAERVFARLLASPPHRRHILGEIEHFRAQTCFGIGFVGTYPTSPLYWCILSAPPPT